MVRIDTDKFSFSWKGLFVYVNFEIGFNKAGRER